ncbi:hypothetical protein [Nocardia veterana]|uniref:hypothetical protein n=1 Tax=Nocardia veterana TaxID=132249 RepID=UPI0002EE5225
MSDDDLRDFERAIFTHEGKSRVIFRQVIAIELDDAAANLEGVLSPHSVLTEHLVDEPGEPTQAALHRVLDFLADRLEAAGRVGR